MYKGVAQNYQYFLYANSIQGQTHPPTPILSAILRLLSHFYGKINHFKVVCYWGFRHPPTHRLVCY